MNDKMKINKEPQTKIANILRKIGTKKCLEKAKMLDNASSPVSTLHLRDLDLNSSNIISISNCLKQQEGTNYSLLKSISFSYNKLIGDTGVIALTESLPKSICEIGLVNCGINDIGGIELLNWMKNSPNLRMVCIEQNNFSEKLRLKFKKFSADNPQILVVF